MPNQTLEPSRKPRRWWLVLFVAVLLLAMAWGLSTWIEGKKNAAAVTAPGAAGNPTGKAGARPQPVQVVAARRADLAVWIDAIGTVTPHRVVTVRARVDGVLQKMPFREGQRVKKGDLLAELDAQPFQILLDQAQGQLTRDQALLDNAQRDLARYKDLWAKDAASRQQLDTQEALVRQYQGALAVDRAQVDHARLQLSYTRILAPMDGQIGLRQVDVGNLVRANDATGLSVITQTQPANAVFAVPERNLSILRTRQARQPLRVEAWAAGQRERLATGRLLTLDNQIDGATGTIRLKAEFENRDERLYANQFVNVRLLLETRAQVLQVPANAVQRGARGAFVYRVAADGRVAVVPVTPDVSEAGWTAIADSDAISPGDALVVDGADRLRDGATARIVDPSKAAPGKGGEGKHKGEGKGEGRRPAQ